MPFDFVHAKLVLVKNRCKWSWFVFEPKKRESPSNTVLNSVCFATLQGQVERKVDSAIHQIVIVS